ncbi:hypothetical protein T09_14281, partial [Trichinella sp. T9]
MNQLLYELTKKFSSTEFDIEHSIMQIMIVTKVPYHLQRCSRSFDLRAQWKCCKIFSEFTMASKICLK